LSIACVYSNKLRRAPLQQAICKAAGGCANIKADLPRDLDLPVIERALQLESAPADISEILAEQTDGTRRRNLRAGLLDLLFFHKDLARKDEGLRAFARGCQTTLHKKFVESNFQDFFANEFYHESASPRSSAKW